MDQKLQKQIDKLGGGDIMSGNDVDPKAVEDIMKEVYDSIGQTVPKGGAAPNGQPVDLKQLTAVDPVSEEEESTTEKAERLANAKNAFQEGQKFATGAVKLDQNERYGAAAVAYDKAITCFGNSLHLGFPRKDEYKQQLVTQVEGYLNRLQEICLQSGDKSLKLEKSSQSVASISQLNRNRRSTFAHLSEHGFSLLTRALQLRKQAKAHEDSDEPFPAFVLYQECLDCLLAYKDTSDKVKHDEATKKTVTKLILDTLDRAEATKALLQQ